MNMKNLSQKNDSVIIAEGSGFCFGVKRATGKLATVILDEYMKGFAERNPNLRVFSAHLHLDEATPPLAH